MLLNKTKSNTKIFTRSQSHKLGLKHLELEIISKIKK